MARILPELRSNTASLAEGNPADVQIVNRTFLPPGRNCGQRWEFSLGGVGLSQWLWSSPGGWYSKQACPKASRRVEHDHIAGPPSGPTALLCISQIVIGEPPRAEPCAVCRWRRSRSTRYLVKRKVRWRLPCPPAALLQENSGSGETTLGCPSAQRRPEFARQEQRDRWSVLGGIISAGATGITERITGSASGLPLELRPEK